MDEIILLLVIIGGAVLIMPITALVFAVRARRRAEALSAEISSLREVAARSIEREARLIRRIEVLEAGAAPTQGGPVVAASAAAPRIIAEDAPCLLYTSRCV